MSDFLDLLATTYIFPILVLTVTFGVGLTMTMASFARIFARPKALSLGVLGQFVWLPAVAIAMGLLLPLGPVISLGLALICLCPGGALSNAIVFAMNGRTALSVSMTVCASILMMITLPFILPPVVELLTGSPIPGVSTVGVLKSLVIAIAVPLALGMLIGNFFPQTADRLVRIIKPLSILLIAAAVSLTFYNARHFVGAEALPIMAAAATLSVLGVGGGFLWSLLFGTDVEDALTIAIEVGVQNTPYVIFLASTVLGRPDLSVVVVSYGVMNLAVMFLLVFALRGVRQRSAERVAAAV
ncbi:bile acid:sodium symporter [uncultured Tateyamaria sp.]|uniref:bile acid:sodium symporter family protein n=1 Tax=uncultured Tateyamaria sp. TaxID=455651 RepID=UPI00260CBCC9|nr:bile acid:sodium symporter [uncultured Tateyamaria sp.]